MELRWVRVATILLVAAGFALSGCEGDDGDDGPGQLGHGGGQPFALGLHQPGGQVRRDGQHDRADELGPRRRRVERSRRCDLERQVLSL